MKAEKIERLIIKKYSKMANDTEFIRELINQTNCPEIIFNELANHYYPEVRKMLAKHKNTPGQVLLKLSTDSYMDVRENAIKNLNYPHKELEGLSINDVINPKCPAHILEKLSQSDNKWVVELVTKNPKCPVSLLENLVNNEEYTIKGNVILNPNCPISILEKLSNDSNTTIRKCLVENPNCPSEILENLAKISKEYYIRFPIARHPNCPLKLLEQLSKEKESDIRYFDSIAQGVAENPNCPASILEKLSNNEDYLVKRAVAQNPNCPLEVLEKLSKDKEHFVREYVARNPNCPPKILEKLATDYDTDVIIAIAKNPQTPPDVFEQVSAKILNWGFAEIYKKTELAKKNNIKLLQFLAKDKSESVRSALASNPNCPLEVLEELSKDKYEHIRIKVAKNQNCSPELLEQLVKDPDPTVRMCAVANLNCPEYLLAYTAESNILGGAREMAQLKIMFSEYFEKTNHENKTPLEQLSDKEIEKARKEKEIQEHRKALLENLAKIAETVKKLNELNADNMTIGINKIIISPEELLEKIDDHYELNKDYLPFIDFIDFSGINTQNLLVSSIDWSHTNLLIDPQKVYKKDLSNAKFSDNNLIFANLEGCNLSGTDLNDEKDSYGYEHAITDERTTLPGDKEASIKQNNIKLD